MEFPSDFDLQFAVRTAVASVGRLSPEAREEAEGDAMLGAAQALARWDAAGGASFRNFALIRMKGAVVDGIRQRAGRHGEKNTTSLDAPAVGGDAEGWDLLPADTTDAGVSVLDNPRVREALAATSPREREAWLLRQQEMTLAAIGERMGITESRVCQLLSDVTDRVHVAVHGRLPDRPLTPTMLRMLACVADGCTYTETAARLNLEPSTVKTVLQRARRRMGANHGAHMVALAYQQGILPLPVKVD